MPTRCTLASDGFNTTTCSESGMPSPSVRRTLFGSYTMPMPPTVWKTGLPGYPTARPALPPLGHHVPVVKRLSLATSLSPPLALQSPSTPNLPKGFPHYEQHDVPGGTRLVRSATDPGLRQSARGMPSADEHAIWQAALAARSKARQVMEATGRDRTKMQQRSKAQVAHFKRQDARARQTEHAARIRFADENSHRALTADENAGLAYVFSNSVHVRDSADGEGRVDLAELRVTLRALGCTPEEEEMIAVDADIYGGGGFAAVADGDARLSPNEFIRVFDRVQRPPLMRQRLASIGKVRWQAASG